MTAGQTGRVMQQTDPPCWTNFNLAPHTEVCSKPNTRQKHTIFFFSIFFFFFYFPSACSLFQRWFKVDWPGASTGAFSVHRRWLLLSVFPANQVLRVDLGRTWKSWLASSQSDRESTLDSWGKQSGPRRTLWALRCRIFWPVFTLTDLFPREASRISENFWLMGIGWISNTFLAVSEIIPMRTAKIIESEGNRQHFWYFKVSVTFLFKQIMNTCF